VSRKKVIDSQWMLVPIFAAPVAAGWIAYDFKVACFVAAGMIIAYVEGRVGWR
jgi:hypothetical protein